MKRKIGDYIEDVIEAMTNAMEFAKKRSIAGMRDKVIHAYFGVKIERVWEVLTYSLR